MDTKINGEYGGGLGTVHCVIGISGKSTIDWGAVPSEKAVVNESLSGGR